MSETVSWTVTHVSDQGVATLRADISDVSGSFNGTSLPAGEMSTRSTTMQIAPDGRVLSAGGLSFDTEAGSSGMGFPGMGQFTPLLPEGRLRPATVGTSTSRRTGLDLGDMHFTGDFTQTLEKV